MSASPGLYLPDREIEVPGLAVPSATGFATEGPRTGTTRTFSREEIEIARAIRAQGGLRGTLRGERIDPISYMEGTRNVQIAPPSAECPSGVWGVQRAQGIGTGFRVIETQKPIQLQPLQRAIIRFGLILHHFKEYTYSTVKKSGKTTITSAVARWVCENFGAFTEVYCLANDLEQAKGRIYNGVLHSLELDPMWNQGKRELRDERGSLLWRHRERELTFAPTRSTMRAVSNDYKGEAGSNPVATFWSELWGYEHEDDIRLWGEMKPVPTRGWSFRWVETYAGFANKEGPLLDRYQVGVKPDKGALRLDCHTFCEQVPDPLGSGGFVERSLWPEGSTIWSPRWTAECDCARNGCGLREHDHHRGPGLPLYVNEDADLFTYWDEQERARRMPWQCGFEGNVPDESLVAPQDGAREARDNDLGERAERASELGVEWAVREAAGEKARKYYLSEYALEPDAQVADRFHKNIWISTQDAFIQVEWWDACGEMLPDLQPPSPLPEGFDPLKATAAEIRALPKSRVPAIMSVDAAVSDDAMAIVLATRHPDPTRFDDVAFRKCKILYPPTSVDGRTKGQFDYNAPFGLKWWIRWYLAQFNILQIAYDAYQLHDVMTMLRNEGLAWCREFSQGADRMEADKALQVSIMQHTSVWPLQEKDDWNWQEAREHLMNADRKILPTEDTKLRIIKRNKNAKIDFTVAASMARHECKRLDLRAA